PGWSAPVSYRSMSRARAFTALVGGQDGRLPLVELPFVRAAHGTTDRSAPGPRVGGVISREDPARSTSSGPAIPRAGSPGGSSDDGATGTAGPGCPGP